MPEVRFKEVSIHYSDEGVGSAVVLLHGFLESISMWKELKAQLIRNNRVVCVDLPGHGKSECIGYVHSMEEMAESVYAVLRRLRLRRVTLIGHSMGGYVALALADEYPDLVKCLVLYHSTARADTPARKIERNKAIDLVKKNADGFIRKSIPMLFRPVNRKRFRTQVNALKLAALKTPTQGVIAALGGMRDRPNRELLLKFPPYPIHLVSGDKDPKIPYHELRELAEISERVSLHLIHGCGHMSFIESKDECMEILENIVSKARRPSFTRVGSL